MATPKGFIVYFADDICKDETRLPADEILDLQRKHNVNLTSDGEDDYWFDESPWETGHIREIDSLEFFERYGE